MLHRHRPRTHRKPVLRTAACLALVGVLGACGSNSTPASGNSSAGSGAGQGTPRIGMELLLAGLPFVAELQAGGGAAAQELGVRVDASAPSAFDPPSAITQVENFLRTRVDGMVIAPEPAPLWTRALTNASTKTNGMTVSIQTPPAAGSPVTTYVGNDATDLGMQTATAAIKAAGLGAGTTGDVIIGICTPQSTPLQQTVAGMRQAVTTQMPNATLRDPFDSKTVPSENFTAWEQQMRAHPDAALILGSCDQDGESMVKAKQTTGGHFAIGATSSSPGVLAGIRDGTVASTVNQNWYVESYTAVRLLVEGLRAGKPPVAGWISPGITVVTKDNVDTIVARDASPEGQAAFYRPLVTKLWADLPASVEPLSALRR